VKVFRCFVAGCLVFGVKFVAEGFCFGIHCRDYVARLVMFKYIMEVSEKSEEGADIFSPRICKRSVYKSKIAAENESVAV